MHPLQRLGVALAGAAAAYAFFPKEKTSWLLQVMGAWVAFSALYIFLCWVVLLTRPVAEIRKVAATDDGSVAYVFAMILLGSIASMFAVLMLLISKDEHTDNRVLFVAVTVGGMLLSWLLVHTVFTFHYAHRYYDNDAKDASKPALGLDFPGDEAPDYLDFTYFSFVIACTFQVSDVQITSRRIRHVVLLHGLLSFGLNTFVVALTINIIAGFMN